MHNNILLLQNSIPNVVWADVLDVVIITFLVYWALVLFKQTKSSTVVLGLILCGALYIVAQALQLTLTLVVFRAFFGVIVIGLIVIFQKELRRFFELIVLEFISLGSPSRRHQQERLTPAYVENIVHVAERLAQQKTGMLVVIRGREALEHHFLQAGFVLNGALSEPLLQSIFDPSTPGHDGAVILEGDIVTRFAVHLPLSEDFQQIKQYGTRHSAALGIAEKADALSIIVSEERGTISVARKGRLLAISDAGHLEQEIHRFLKETMPPTRRASFFERNVQEKILALLIAVALWYVVVYLGR